MSAGGQAGAANAFLTMCLVVEDSQRQGHAARLAARGRGSALNCAQQTAVFCLNIDACLYEAHVHIMRDNAFQGFVGVNVVKLARRSGADGVHGSEDAACSQVLEMLQATTL